MTALSAPSAVSHDLRGGRQGIRQVRALGQRGHQAHPPLVAAVVEGRHELATGVGDAPDVPEAADLVVAAGQDLEHRLVLGDPVREPLARGARSAAAGLATTASMRLGVVRGRPGPRPGGRAARARRGRRVRGPPRSAGRRTRRSATLRASSPMAGWRSCVAATSRSSVSPQLLAQRGRQRVGVAQPAVEEPGHGRQLRRHALLREEDAVGGLGQLAAARRGRRTP